MSDGHRVGEAGTTILDKWDGYDLVGYLEGLNDKQLAHGWVSLVISAGADEGMPIGTHTLGELSKSLAVVARRLHGVTFEPATIQGD